MATPTCRLCSAPLKQTFLDLGTSPLANAYLAAEDLSRGEPFYRLHAYVCRECLLVQLEEFETPENIFSEYPYFSSYSATLLAEARAYAEAVVKRFGLGAGSTVVEIASNDGYLLQYFVGRGIPVLGIDPAANVAKAAIERGVPTLVDFFGRRAAGELRKKGTSADLLIGNNVLAHVPDLNDFIAGMKMLLAPRGVITMEFPHLLRLIEGNQFDTIYHEHFSYFSFHTVEDAFARHGLAIFDVDEIPAQGGSLRIYARHAEDSSRPVSDNVSALRRAEEDAGLLDPDDYGSFSDRVVRAKCALIAFALEVKRQGRSIAAYGAAAKGNTLLNYCGLGRDFIDFVVDRNPYKQGRFLPGTRLPIHGPEKVAAARPDYLLILPWNLKKEIMQQMAGIGEWGGAFVIPIPEVQVLAGASSHVKA
jgi:SAM-dependent methyltransferase